MAFDDLYEDDFYVWTQEQAAALRAAAKAGGRSNAVEWERLAEEVEDLGKRERREVTWAATLIVECFYKASWSERKAERANWREQVVRHQCDLDGRITASFRPLLRAELETIHKRAARLANARFDADEPDAPRDEALRWTLEEILGTAA